MIPLLTELIEANHKMMGDDPWPYGMTPNRATLETFLRYHHEQGFSQRRFAPEELFAPETLDD
jgi:4,5-dihydroxyphthalate decarboxylase